MESRGAGRGGDQNNIPGRGKGKGCKVSESRLRTIDPGATPRTWWWWSLRSSSLSWFGTLFPPVGVIFAAGVVQRRMFCGPSPVWLT